MTISSATPPTIPDERIRIREVTLLSDDWYVLKKTIFDYRRRDGSWQTLSRETYDRGNGAALLLYDPARGTVLLTRQFRFPAYVNGHAEPLLEVCAGLLDDRSPEEAIRAEAAEELGVSVQAPRRVFDAFMSPGSVTERLAFFVAEYRAADRSGAGGAGGGIAEEGEDIEVVELTFADALAMVGSGAILDGKTIMLLQYAALHGLLPR
ncbi:NUDIX domain-containing protein [Azospirillum sp. YIM B02556]|uniref:GDP-mannose pyrophosphatase n=1 Tax=Azospirillum endophyticum TaxID=2800326 RepID=A0ABS1F3B2_9PROT|nr:NUDIX domain-containing protein [Azospirillum endophyticum]MBK1837883.1 NUDIX domain-containing protein [Azospirillum endophyticum]